MRCPVASRLGKTGMLVSLPSAYFLESLPTNFLTLNASARLLITCRVALRVDDQHLGLGVIVRLVPPSEPAPRPAALWVQFPNQRVIVEAGMVKLLVNGAFPPLWRV